MGESVMGEIKEGYCSTHGYCWCKCLAALDNINLIMEIIRKQNEKRKSKAPKAASAPIIRPKAPRV